MQAPASTAVCVAMFYKKLGLYPAKRLYFTWSCYIIESGAFTWVYSSHFQALRLCLALDWKIVSVQILLQEASHTLRHNLPPGKPNFFLHYKAINGIHIHKDSRTWVICDADKHLAITDKFWIIAASCHTPLSMTSNVESAVCMCHMNLNLFK